MSGSRSLDLAFDTPAACEAWYVGLQALLLRQRASVEDSDLKHLRRAFLLEDWHGEGALSYDRIKAILRRLNIYRSKKALRAVFNAADATGSGRLTFDAFVRLVDSLRDRPDIHAVFKGAIEHHAAGAAAAAAAADVDAGAGTGGAGTPVGVVSASPLGPRGGGAASGSGVGGAAGPRASPRLSPLMAVAETLAPSLPSTLALTTPSTATSSVASVGMPGSLAVAGVGAAAVGGASHGSGGGVATIATAAFLAFLHESQCDTDMTLDDAARIMMHFDPPRGECGVCWRPVRTVTLWLQVACTTMRHHLRRLSIPF